MDAEGNVIATHEGPRTLDAFEETAKKAQAYIDLKKKAEKGDKSAKIDLTIADLEAGRLKPDEATKKLEGLELSKDQKKSLEAAQANGDVKAIYDPYKALSNEDPEAIKKARIDIGEKLLARKKAGKPAPSGDQEWQMYWFGLLGYGELKKDAAVYEEALNAIKGKYGKEPQAKGAIAQMEKTLAELKKGSGDKKDDEKK
jgi:hypothetical protein